MAAKLLVEATEKLCVQCHTEVVARADQERHVHAPVKDNCGSCHDAHASDHKFQLREAAPKLCVTCHKDVEKALASAHTVHGAVTQADGCVSCHAPHYGGNPSVRPEQFANEEAYKRAAHLDRNPEFLLLHQDRNFVAAARGRSVAYFCRKCHAKIKEQHLGSPHGEFGDPTCLYCHGGGSHGIQRATAEIIDTRPRSDGGRCSPCHRAGTMEAVGRIKATLLDTEAQIKTSGELYTQLEASGLSQPRAGKAPPPRQGGPVAAPADLPWL